MWKTFAFSEWMSTENCDSPWMFKVFLTDGGFAFMLLAAEGKMAFFQLDPDLLKFKGPWSFSRMLGDASELPIELAFEAGFLTKDMMDKFRS